MSTPEREFDTGLEPADLDPDRPRPVETPWGTMALFSSGEKVRCVQAFCPHLAGPLFQGTVAEGEVTCPWHGWRFDLGTGARRHPALPEDAPAVRLERCDAAWSARGTIVLRRPAR
jgi:nitrite reductase/ring-hydroxylating ferredoxin subunit